MKKIKTKAKKIVKKISKDPLTKEFVEEEKGVARKMIGNAAKRAKEEIRAK